MSEAQSASKPFILFQLGETTYAVHSHLVQQMQMIEHVTPVPNAPLFVEGVVLARGRVVPVINLRVRFGFEKIPYDMRTRLIILQHEERHVGLVVDAAREFTHIPLEVIQPPPDTIAGLSGHYLEGIATLGERLILILQVDEVLNLADEIEDVTEL